MLVSGAASLAGHVATRGLQYIPTGPDLRPIDAPLVVHDVDQERAAVGAYFVSRLGHARADALVDLFCSWGPDVVIRDEVDFGSVVAAEALSLPHAAVNVVGAGGFILPSVVREPLVALCATFALEPQPDAAAMLHRYLTLTPFPARFRDPLDPLPGRVVSYGTAIAQPACLATEQSCSSRSGRSSTPSRGICLLQRLGAQPPLLLWTASSSRPGITWTLSRCGPCQRR